MAEVRHVDQILLFDVVARPRELSYRVTNAATGAIYSYDAPTGVIGEGKQEYPLLPHQIATEPIPVRLAFPLSLGIWGRSGDSYRMTGARESENKIVVELVHQKDDSLTGDLVIDRKRRMAIRLDTPTLVIVYRDVQLIADGF